MLFCQNPDLELQTSGTFAFCFFLSEHTQVIELMKTRAILRTSQESQGYTQLSYKLVRFQAYIKFIGEVSSYLHF